MKKNVRDVVIVFFSFIFVLEGYANPYEQTLETYTNSQSYFQRHLLNVSKKFSDKKYMKIANVFAKAAELPQNHPWGWRAFKGIVCLGGVSLLTKKWWKDISTHSLKSFFKKKTRRFFQLLPSVGKSLLPQ